MKQKFTSEEIINSLQGIGRAEPHPFLFTRIQSKMMKEEKLPELAVFRFITRPAFVLSLLVLFVSINGYIAIQKLNDISNDDFAQSIAAEYVQPDALPYDSNEAP